jgi:hypothetical protein
MPNNNKNKKEKAKPVHMAELALALHREEGPTVLPCLPPTSPALSLVTYLRAALRRRECVCVGTAATWTTCSQDALSAALHPYFVQLIHCRADGNCSLYALVHALKMADPGQYDALTVGGLRAKLVEIVRAEYDRNENFRAGVDSLADEAKLDETLSNLLDVAAGQCGMTNDEFRAQSSLGPSEAKDL